MPKGYIKIEWSGFWDFPATSYNGGTKDGVPKSGVFDTDHIILDSVSNAEYEIDPAEIGVPKSPDFSFSLKNKSEVNGNFRYPFEYMSTLGRTEEYGGNLTDFGDLYIRASIPMLNDKVIFKGIVNEFSYSAHNFEVKIGCTDFVGQIKNSEDKMFYQHEFEDVKIVGIDNNTNSIASDLVGSTITSVIDQEGNQLNFSKLKIRIGDMSTAKSPLSGGDCCPALNYAHDPDWDIRYDYPITSIYLGNAPYEDTSAINEINNWISDKYKQVHSKSSIKEFVERFLTQDVVLDYMKDANPTYTGLNDDDNTSPPYDFYTRWRNAFIKIGESTIFTKFRVHFHCGLYGTVSGTDINKDYHVNDMDWWYELEILHANNGATRQLVNSEGYLIMERGRFLKKADNEADAQYKVGDKISITIFDYKIEGEDLSLTSQNPIVDQDFGLFGEGGGVPTRDELFIHGFIFGFDISTDEMKVDDFEGYFNSFLSGMNAIEENYMERFTEGSPSGLMFNYSGVIEDLFQYCYVSDIIHYGWIENKIHEIIINYAYQISSYLYADENGAIRFKSRSYLHPSDKNILSIATKIHKQDYEIISPTDYTYGSKYYRIEYSDQLEINNLEGSEEVSINIDSGGNIVNTTVKPRDLDIANFRTSDLGVPDSDGVFNGSYILRKSPIVNSAPIPEDYFIMNPVEQASNIARGINYPSRLFSIALDVMYGENKGYFDIGIGSYVYTETNDENTFDIYLVKKINYSPVRLRSKSTSVNIELLFVLKYTKPIYEENIDSVSIGQDVKEYNPPVVRDYYDDSIIVSGYKDGRIVENISFSTEDLISALDNTKDYSPPIIRSEYIDSINVSGYNQGDEKNKILDNVNDKIYIGDSPNDIYTEVKRSYFLSTIVVSGFKNRNLPEKITDILTDRVEVLEYTNEDIGPIPQIDPPVLNSEYNTSTQDVHLTWNSSEKVKEYKIEKDGVVISTQAENFYYDYIDRPGTHSYRVKAIPYYGQASVWSNEVTEVISMTRPIVSTGGLDPNGGGLRGYLHNTGGDSACSCNIQYRQVGVSSWQETFTITMGTPGPYGGPPPTSPPGEYETRAKAVNDIGTSYGDIVNFTV